MIFKKSKKSAFGVAVEWNNIIAGRRILFYTEGIADLTNINVGEEGIPQSVIELIEKNEITSLLMDDQWIKNHHGRIPKAAKNLIRGYKQKKKKYTQSLFATNPIHFNDKTVKLKKTIHNIHYQDLFILGSESSGKSSLLNVCFFLPLFSSFFLFLHPFSSILSLPLLSISFLSFLPFPLPPPSPSPLFYPFLSPVSYPIPLLSISSLSLPLPSPFLIFFLPFSLSYPLLFCRFPLSSPSFPSPSLTSPFFNPIFLGQIGIYLEYMDMDIWIWIIFIILNEIFL